VAKEMFVVMRAAEGVGMACNQSGDKTKWLDEAVMVNPQITELFEAKDVDMEGCLSFR
jgi:peptide deformylase